MGSCFSHQAGTTVVSFFQRFQSRTGTRVTTESSTHGHHPGPKLCWYELPHQRGDKLRSKWSSGSILNANTTRMSRERARSMGSTHLSQAGSSRVKWAQHPTTCQVQLNSHEQQPGKLPAEPRESKLRKCTQLSQQKPRGPFAKQDHKAHPEHQRASQSHWARTLTTFGHWSP